MTRTADLAELDASADHGHEPGGRCRKHKKKLCPACALSEAAGSMAKASTHKKGLEDAPGKSDNWVERTGPGGKGGQLPAYIQHIALAIHRKRGVPKSQAIAIAIGTVKRWAAGAGNVDATTRAASAKAVGEWEKMKAKNAAKDVAEAVLDLYEAVALEEAQRGSRAPTSPGQQPAGQQSAGPPASTPPQREPEDAKGGDSAVINAGERVSHLQRRLGSLGWEVKDDGSFGPKTAEAVKEFQHHAGIKEDGLVGPVTSEMLRSAPHSCEESLLDDATRLVELQRERIEEASVRGAARKVELRRLPDGTFAPKGRGQVLKAGMEVKLPHADAFGAKYGATVVSVHGGNAVLSSHTKGYEVLDADGKLAKPVYSKHAADELAKSLKPVGAPDQWDPPVGAAAEPAKGGMDAEVGPDGEFMGPKVGSTLADKDGTVAKIIAKHDAENEDDAKFTVEVDGKKSTIGYGKLADVLAGKKAWAKPKPPQSPGTEPEGVKTGPHTGTGKGVSKDTQKFANGKLPLAQFVEGKSPEELEAVAALLEKDAKTVGKSQLDVMQNVSKRWSGLAADLRTHLKDKPAPPASPGVDPLGAPIPQPDDGDDALASSPGRGPTGKIRNFKAMKPAKLKAVVAELEQYGKDPDALSAAMYALNEKDAKAAHTAEVKAKPGSKPKRSESELAALSKNFSTMSKANLQTWVDDLTKDGSDPEALAAAKGALAGKSKPVIKSYDPKTGPSAEEKDANAATMKGGPTPAKADPGPTPANPDVAAHVEKAWAARKAKPEVESTDPATWKDNDPLATVTDLAARVAQLEQSPAQQWQPNNGADNDGTPFSIKDVPFGTQIEMQNGNQYTVHKAVNDPWIIMKPVGGGKAKPIHKMYAPAKIGPMTEGYGDATAPVGKPAAAPDAAAAGDDLAAQLAKSVEIAKGAKEAGAKPQFEAVPAAPAVASLPTPAPEAATTALAAYTAAGGSDPAVIAALQAAAQVKKAA